MLFSHSAQPKGEERAEDRDRRAEQDAERQRPTLVKRGENEEDEKERHSEHERRRNALLRFLFLIGHAEIIVAHLVRHGLAKTSSSAFIA